MAAPDPGTDTGQTGAGGGMDWQTPLSAGLGFAYSSVLLLASGLYRLLAWVVVRVPGYLYRALSVVATPLTYPLYYAYRLLLFLLSPLWAIGRVVAGACAWVVGMAIKLKYLYIYFTVAALIGIAAACMVHGTSTVLFLLLRIDRSTAASTSFPSTKANYGASSRKQLQESAAAAATTTTTTAGEYDYDAASDASSTPDDFDTLPELHQGDRPVMTDALCELAFRRAKSTRLSPLRPSRRFRGLLAQTIHEESSESES
ncbi:hypothetical protein JX265_013611 [Neoarthrinium moseri]|uniref:Uncharacterized protein n=1 Tax=Neoarthrinium moseri TaxID=1658444 RepID=A0A9P9W825_9PEZI|nr:hypothetical protein JX265_013611 [Neoarthrinium moseri]